jgi:hypothetical protein
MYPDMIEARFGVFIDFGKVSFRIGAALIFFFPPP